MHNRLLIILFLGFVLSCEDKHSTKSTDSESGFKSDSKLWLEYGQNKTLPEGYEQQALLALSHYPKRKDIQIDFVFSKTGPPLQARPTVWSTLTNAAPKRIYQVRIATDAGPMLQPILLQNMPFEAQVGVLGHELAHIADFSTRSFGGMLEVLFGNLSPSYLDEMEYCTDNRAIEHGLGTQLWAWSSHVHQSFDSYFAQNGDQASIFLKKIMENERYMRPETIKQRMQEIDLYKYE